MSNTAARLLTLLFLPCILTSAQVFAQVVPAPVARNGVTYVTGGIGEDEVRAFHEVAAKYNMRITLASKAGHYLSDVDVRITSGQRDVLVVRTEGPFLFVSVPAGRYQVSARDRHVTKTKQVVVPQQGGIDVHLYWDDSDHQGVKVLCRRCSKRSQQ
jgi:MFS superfamily sulfate permease-like transporter